MKITRTILFDLAIILCISALAMLPIVKVRSDIDSFIHECLTYRSSKKIMAEHSQHISAIASLTDALTFTNCTYSEYSPEIANYMIYNDYLGTYNEEWINNLTSSLGSYSLEVSSWQADMAANVAEFNHDLVQVNNQIRSIKDISSKIGRSIGLATSQLNVILQSIPNGVSRIRWRFSKKVLGQRVSFSIGVPVGICDVLPEACKIQDSIADAISDMLLVRVLVNELSLVSLTSIPTATIPDPPSFPIIPDYQPQTYVPYNRTLSYEDLALASVGVSYYSEVLLIPGVDFGSVIIAITVLSVLSGFATYYKYRLSRHSFYSVEAMVMKLERSKGSLLLVIRHSLLKIILVFLTITVGLSILEDTECNYTRLYSVGRVNMSLEEYNSMLLDSINSCLVCHDNQTLCNPAAGQVNYSASFSQCGDISGGFLNNLKMAFAILLGYLVVMMPSGIVKDILCLRSISTSPSIRRMSETRREDWLFIMKDLLIKIYGSCVLLRILSIIILLSPLNPLQCLPALLLATLFEISM